MSGVRETLEAAAAHARAGRPTEALSVYDALLAEHPAHAAALVNRAALLNEMGRPAEALESCDRALHADPGLAPAHSNRARALLQLDRPQAALEAADRALALNPGHVRAWLTRGDAFAALGRYAPALECYRAAGRAEPADIHPRLMQGVTLRALGRYADAIEAFDAAERLDPADGTASYQRAMVRLLTGDFEGGWADFRGRWRSPPFLAAAAGFVTPPLRGALLQAPQASDLAGKRLLVVSEQGIGDQLMFASLLPDLLTVAQSVACVCEARLAALLSASFPEIRFFDSRDGVPTDLPEPEAAVAAGELGGLFRNRIEDFPGEPYVRPRNQVAEAWRERLGPKARKLRIGLSWRGGTPSTGRAARSIPLDQLGRLLALKDCEFVSLQYGDHAAEVAACKAPLRAFPAAEIDDFEALAGLVANLDLVVSVQTAVVHLAGALGTPCLTMVPVRPEWRYMTQTETMPWYRSVRIFRQDATEAWAPVVDQVVRAVAARAAEPA